MEAFEGFPKLARLNREVVITEKIDGTNAQVYIKALDGFAETDPACIWQAGGLAIFAGSRTRWITPGADNFGFAAWVKEHAGKLVELGEGRHFGEWWGSGIQRRYGLSEKRFSLFNTNRWHGSPVDDWRCIEAPICHVVPTLVVAESLSKEVANNALDLLRKGGSLAAPGFMDPEGIVMYHRHSGSSFKVTIEGDEKGKGEGA